jgi:hypothetical protein
LVIVSLFVISHSSVAADPADEATRALDRLNSYRKSAGLEPVTLDVDLSRACRAHADYLFKNAEAAFAGKLNVHDEDAKLPGYSAAGRKAARASVVSQMYGVDDPLLALDLWMASFYHRVSLLDPTQTRVGIGIAQQKQHAWIVVLDHGSSKDRMKAGSRIVCYPAKDQQDVPLVFSLGAPEVPNPIPDNGASKDAGHPITVSVYTDRPVIRDVAGSLRDADGKEAPVWLSWQERPAAKNYGRNSICLIPRAPLKPNTTYTVTVKAMINGREWKNTWSFRTGERSGPRVAKQADF